MKSTPYWHTYSWVIVWWMMHLFWYTSFLLFRYLMYNTGRGQFLPRKVRKERRQNGHMACQTPPLLLELVPAPDTKKKKKRKKHVGVSWEVIWLVLNKWQSHTHIYPEQSKYSVISTWRSRSCVSFNWSASTLCRWFKDSLPPKKKGTIPIGESIKTWFVRLNSSSPKPLIPTPVSPLSLFPSCARKRKRKKQKSINGKIFTISQMAWRKEYMKLSQIDNQRSCLPGARPQILP